MKVHYAAALLALTLAVGSAKADFNLVDNFDSYNIGADLSAGSVGNWATGGVDNVAGQATIQLDPSGTSGNVLQLFDTAGNLISAYNSTPSLLMPKSTTPATVFFRVRNASSPTVGLEIAGGMTDQTSVSVFGSGRSWTIFDGTAGSNQIAVGSYDAGATNTSKTYHTTQTVNTDSWSKVWMVFHNDGSGTTGGTYDVYIQGATSPTQNLVYAGNYFRDSMGLGPAGALKTFALVCDDAGINYIDDIYVDTSSAIGNLADPTVPEPATLSLLGASLVGLLVRRTRR